ncbi:MAG TPA: hypothetical protein VGH27_09025 [Streptosporangiaceae bacterium]|jgi:hypothetical protein
MTIATPTPSWTVQPGAGDVISFATGATVLFSLGGGIALAVVVFVIGYGFRLLFMQRRKPVS